jgi:hypothetical protein
MQGVFVNGKMEDIQFKKIQLTNNAIIAFIGKTENPHFNRRTEIIVQNYSDFFFI